MDSSTIIITTFFSGLMAGLFYTWTISVTPGLAKTDNGSYLKAFQSMNRAILNPLFFIVFFGTVAFFIYLTIFRDNFSNSYQYWLILAAAILYLGGIILVTIFGNIPLNNKLEELQIDTMTAEQMSEFRQDFETRWNGFNKIRTVCSILSFTLMIMACIQNNNL